MNRRDFLSAATVTALTAPATAATGRVHVALEEITLAGIAAAFADGRLTSRRLTQMYLERIAALNHRGPALRAVLETNPQALDIAAALDEERRLHGAHGPGA